VLPDTESMSPFTQSLPLADGDGDDDEDEEGAELVGFVEVGFASLEAPHAAMDIAVAPVTASSATRDSRVVEKVAGIGVLSIVGRNQQTGSGNDRHDRRRR
jgi:hypothetical protein